MLICAFSERKSSSANGHAASGFTLLEVLVALSILAIVAFTLIRACGEGLVYVADSGWADMAVRVGRAKMQEVVLEGGKGNLQGTLAPLHPELKWEARVHSLPDLPGRRLEFILSEGVGKARHELFMEQILYP